MRLASSGAVAGQLADQSVAREDFAPEQQGHDQQGAAWL